MMFYRIDEEIMYGSAETLLNDVKKEIIEQIKGIESDNYENVCYNMRVIADVIEILQENIGKEDDFIVLKYNPMGAWYKEEENEDNKEEFEEYRNSCYGG